MCYVCKKFPSTFTGCSSEMSNYKIASAVVRCILSQFLENLNFLNCTVSLTLIYSLFQVNAVLSLHLIFKLNTSYQTLRKPAFSIEGMKWFICVEIHYTVDDQQNIFLCFTKECITYTVDELPGFVVWLGFYPAKA